MPSCPAGFLITPEHWERRWLKRKKKILLPNRQDSGGSVSSSGQFFRAVARSPLQLAQFSALSKWRQWLNSLSWRDAVDPRDSPFRFRLKLPVAVLGDTLRLTGILSRAHIADCRRRCTRQAANAGIWSTRLVIQPACSVGPFRIKDSSGRFVTSAGKSGKSTRAALLKARLARFTTLRATHDDHV